MLFRLGGHTAVHSGSMIDTDPAWVRYPERQNPDGSATLRVARWPFPAIAPGKEGPVLFCEENRLVDIEEFADGRP
jgi:hypothetical protein